MLQDAVASVLAQTFKDFELIILDDNSPDRCHQEILAGYWDAPQIRIYKDNVQPADRYTLVRYAVLANIGLKLARGHYITYLCDDDLYFPERLELMTRRLDQGDCQVVYGRQQLRYEGYAGERTEPGRLVQPSDIFDDAWRKVDHSSVMHTKAAALEAGGWDEDPQYWKRADSAFWRRLNAAGHKFYPVCEYTDIRRFHPDSVSVNASIREH
jgi:glycosyltransferase involved in cell wall biosynthesis